MEIAGKVWKDGKFWLVEVPVLDILTQGLTRKEAVFMVEDAILQLIECYFESKELNDFKLEVIDYKGSDIGVRASNNNIMLSFSLIRQREKSGSTVREAAERLGSSSPNSYAQYERGKTRISLDQYEKLLHAANPIKTPRLRII